MSNKPPQYDDIMDDFFIISKKSSAHNFETDMKNISVEITKYLKLGYSLYGSHQIIVGSEHNGGEVYISQAVYCKKSS